jgi:hypothetical protein
MSSLILPPTALYNLEREAMAERHGALRWFDQQLKQIDPALDLVRAAPHASAPGMVPDFWHVRRRNGPGVIDSYIAITGDDGGFVEPASWWLERFRADDAWTNGGWDAMKKRWDAREASRARDKENRRVARVEEIAGRIKAIDSPGVSMTDAGAWRYRARARRG